jgi:hypothetical protein
MATMDFIDGLPQSRQYNCILVVVDKLSKYAHFIPLAHPYTASTVADLFVNTVYRLHGMPLSIVSDRDPVFTSAFWQCVFRTTGTQLRLSTANHPETDGQTERVNQSLECYLRCFTSAHSKKWSQWLGLCEFWYNTNWHSSLGKSPFEVIYGRQPRYFGVTASSSILPGDIQNWLQERQLVIASARHHLLRMQQRMKHQADKHRSERTFSVGEQVFLKLQPYLQTSVVRRPNHKLAYKFFGPFRILERIGAVAYKLALPEHSRVHPVFHVSQLKKCLGPGQQVQSPHPPPDNSFQIPLQVLQRRVRQKGLRTLVQGLIKWSNAAEDAVTWEDLEALQQQFPAAPAWGQAGFQEEGIVSDPAPPGSDTEAGSPKASPSPARPRPNRNRREPRWLENYHRA